MSLLYQYAGQPDDMPHFDTEKALAKFRNRIGQKRKIIPFFYNSYFLKVAAAVAILLVSVVSLYYFLPQNSETVRLTAVENSEKFEVFENTNITLYAGSEIIYKTKSKQEMKLIGKATFKVDSENDTEGITVQAGETYVKDIGTLFTVDATSPDRFITVDVGEGEVWFYTETNKGINLKVGESAIYDVQRKQFYMELIFHNTPLLQAINLIKNRYNVDIVLNSGELNDVFLNASFDKNETLENVLNIITLTVAANLSKKDDVYIITAQ
jgi:ferric-dicitrate binding protein FerR (iron transport regulator)